MLSRDQLEQFVHGDGMNSLIGSTITTVEKGASEQRIEKSGRSYRIVGIKREQYDQQPLTTQLEQVTKNGEHPISLRLDDIVKIIKRFLHKEINVNELSSWAFIVMGSNGVEYDLKDREKISEIVGLLEQFDELDPKKHDNIIKDQILPLIGKR